MSSPLPGTVPWRRRKLADPRRSGNWECTALAARDGLLRESARQALVREQLLAPANAILAYGQLLADRAPSGSREAGYLVRIVNSARQVNERLALAGAALNAGEDDLPLLRRLRHDLRSPLGAIKGFAELLLEDGADLPGEDLARMVECVAEILRRVDELGAGAGTDTGTSEIAAALAATADALPSTAAGSAGPRPGRSTTMRTIGSCSTTFWTQPATRSPWPNPARQGWRFLARQPADLVLLDLLMPAMNGLEVLLALRRRPALAEIPVLVLSGVDHAEMTGQCLAAGAQDFIRKPFDTAILRARVAAALERKRLRDRERHYLAQLDAEKRRAEALLANILPAAVIARLAKGERTIADRIEPVTVLFADIVGFTRIAARLSPIRLVADLDQLVSAFDALAVELGVEKIKTVGDAYLAVAGVPETRLDHAQAAAELALRMIEAATAIAPGLGADYRLRVGLHSGPVLAGVIGRRKFSYDVWGDTVNIAARLQQLAAPATVTLSEATRAILPSPYRTEPLGEVELRGRGRFATFRLGRNQS